MQLRTAQTSPYHSPSRPQPRLAYSRNKSQQRSRISPVPLPRPIYFCHYRNAMYMGGIKSTDKHGLGIILHDNGSSAISHYENDSLHGHTVVVTGESEIMSIEYQRNKVQEAVYRNRQEMLFVRYGREGFVEGDAVLVDYQKREIQYARMVRGVVTGKRVEGDQIVKDRVLNLRQLELLITKKHAKALTFQLDFGADLLVSRKPTKVTVGFSKNKHIEGLGFTLLTKYPQRADQQSSLIISQRGLYSVSRLEGLGERRFQNGNVYIGEFSNDLFNGSGLLLNTVKKNWVCGQFASGNLVELTSYDNEGKQSPSEKVLAQLHRKKSSWRDFQITLPDPMQFRRQIRKIQTYRQQSFPIIDIQHRKQQVLKRIQSNFTHQIQTDQGTTISQVQPSILQVHQSQPIRQMSRKIINQFEISNDSTNHKVKLKPLDIPPDLRKKVEEREKQEKQEKIEKQEKSLIKIRQEKLTPPKIESRQQPPEIRVTSPMNRLKTDQEGSTSRRKARIFSGRESQKNQSPMNRQTAVASSSDRRQTLSSSKRNRIFSTTRKSEQQANNSLENKETARLGEEYSPIVSKRSQTNSIEDSKRFVGPRAKIFSKNIQEEPVSFRYSRYVGAKTPEPRSSSRRNRIF